MTEAPSLSQVSSDKKSNSLIEDREEAKELYKMMDGFLY